MEGYEMSLIRKAIDNNNPFPEKSSAERAAIQDRKTRIRDGYESDSSESQQTKLTSSSNVGTISYVFNYCSEAANFILNPDQIHHRREILV